LINKTITYVYNILNNVEDIIYFTYNNLVLVLNIFILKFKSLSIVSHSISVVYLLKNTLTAMVLSINYKLTNWVNYTFTIVDLIYNRIRYTFTLLMGIGEFFAKSYAIIRTLPIVKRIRVMSEVELREKIKEILKRNTS